MSSCASARTAALANNLLCDSRPSNVDSTSSLAAVIIDCLDFLQQGGRARPHLVGPTNSFHSLCLSSHKLRGPRCLSSRNRTNRQFLARSSPLQTAQGKASWPAGHLRASASPAASASATALTDSLSCKARPYKQLRKTAQGKAAWPTVPQLAQALTDSFLHEARPCNPCRKRKTAQGKASWPAGHLRASPSPGPPQLSSPL